MIYDEDDRQTLVKEAMRELDFDERALTPGAVVHRISHAKNQMLSRRGRGAARAHAARGAHRLALPRSTRSAAGRGRASTSTTCCSAWCGCSRRCRRRSTGTARLWRTCWSTSTRTPTARSTASSSCSPRSTGTSASWATPTSRSTAGAAPISATSSTSRRTSRTAGWCALEQNYRSTKRILDIASAVIANNTARKDKRLWTENGEGERGRGLPGLGRERGVRASWPRSIRGLRGEGVDYRDVAVFYRTNAQSRVLEDALRRASIPYLIVGGVRFYERREIKDVVAYLRLVVNPLDDVAFRRAVGRARRAAIGKATLDRLAERGARERASRSSRPARHLPADFSSKPRQALEDFARADRAARPSGARGCRCPRFIDEVLRGLRLPRRAPGRAHRRRPRRGSRTWRSWSPRPRSSSRARHARASER